MGLKKISSALLFAILLMSVVNADGFKFLVVGDWGWEDNHAQPLQTDGCAKAVGHAMQQESDVKFVINVGDSAYLSGVAPSERDSFFNTMWPGFFGDLTKNVPWYSVYGNHDIVGKDNCVCGGNSTCTLVTGSPTKGWYMPDLHYMVKSLDGSKVTLIALEQNAHDINAMICDHCQCPNSADCKSTCQKQLQSFRDASNKMLDDYMQNGGCEKDETCILVGHYPLKQLTDAEFTKLTKEYMTDQNKNVVYFAGHLHRTLIDDSNPRGWIIGGGGGYACESGGPNGYAVGNYDATAGKISVEIKEVDCSNVPVDNPAHKCKPVGIQANRFEE